MRKFKKLLYILIFLIIPTTIGSFTFFLSLSDNTQASYCDYIYHGGNSYNVKYGNYFPKNGLKNTKYKGKNKSYVQLEKFIKIESGNWISHGTSCKIQPSAYYVFLTWFTITLMVTSLAYFFIIIFKKTLKINNRK